jgi:acyl-coenzyme A thioesterase PaaI-like protein
MADETRDLADAIRFLIERMVATEAPPEVFAGVADDLRAVARRFEPFDKVPLYSGYAEAANAGDPAGPFDHSPLLGVANPLSPPLRLQVEDDRSVVGTATFGSAYEGPPGCVHGGMVAAAFDELLGFAQIIGGNPGMTGRLIVHYRSPTPLHTELRLAGSIDRIEGRKTFCTGTIHAGDRLCAEAEGLFVAMGGERFQSLIADRQARLASDGGGSP